MRKMALARIPTLLVVAMIVGSKPLLAQGVALRGGTSVNPVQLYGGAQYAFAPIWETLRPTPSVELGAANGAPLLSVNLDALLHSRPLGPRSAWNVLAGGGPAINWYRLASHTGHTKMGMHAVGVLGHSSGWFGEFRLGYFDGPTIRMGVGYRLAVRSQAAQRRNP